MELLSFLNHSNVYLILINFREKLCVLTVEKALLLTSIVNCKKVIRVLLELNRWIQSMRKERINRIYHFEFDRNKCIEHLKVIDKV